MGLLDRPQLLDVCLSAPSKIQLRLVKDAFGCTNIVFSKMQHLKRYMTYKYIYIQVNYIYILIVYIRGILLKMMDENIFELPG